MVGCSVTARRGIDWFRTGDRGVWGNIHFKGSAWGGSPRSPARERAPAGCLHSQGHLVLGDVERDERFDNWDLCDDNNTAQGMQCLSRVAQQRRYRQLGTLRDLASAQTPLPHLRTLYFCTHLNLASGRELYSQSAASACLTSQEAPLSRG